MPFWKQDEHKELVARVRGGESYTGFETVRRRKDGTLVDVVMAAAPRPRRAGSGGRVRLEWDTPVERGSGIASYSVLVDGKVVRRLDPIAYTATVRAGRGRHVVGVAAIDRAANRGPAATRRVRLP